MNYEEIANRIAATTERRVIMSEDTKTADDDAHANVDQAIDNILAGIITIEENLPEVKTDNVPQQAALEGIQELLDEAIKPYMADIMKAMEIFPE